MYPQGGTGRIVKDYETTDVTDITEAELEELSAGGTTTLHSHAGGGMVQHANEWHDPDMSLATHNHTLLGLSERAHTSLTSVLADQHADTKVRSKVVDETAIADNRILVYKTASGTLVYEDKPAGATAREEDVASWCTAVTLTNVGSTFKDLYAGTNSDGKSFHVDFTGKTQVAACVDWNKIGTGTQTIQAVQADLTSNVLFTKDVVSGHNDFALASLPAWATGQKRIKLQVKSTTAADDPVFEACSIRLK